MASSDLTLMKDRKQLESYVENTPHFNKSIRFIEHPEREGYLIVTDGSYSFGMMPYEDVQKVLADQIQPEELKSRPDIIKYISCFEIDANTKDYKREQAKTAVDRLEEKVPFFSTNKKMVIWLIIITVVAAIVPFISAKIFSTTTSSYSDRFYQAGLVDTTLTRYNENWSKFVETKETYDEKVADYIASDIARFSEEIDTSRLTELQNSNLDQLLEKVKTYKANK
ncbi:hypothetical protein BVX99_00980 [bacterium F16]|nr:hypothetical protein BVX99_00980 [bacterium F16]